jgi:pimeloyl-ACP methyl ester carboxylesterase
MRDDDPRVLHHATAVASRARGTAGLSRRRFIGGLPLGLGAVALSPWLAGCPEDCTPPLPWIPSVLAPVFYGYQDVVVPRGGLPSTRMRVFYPSLEGSPPDAPMVTCLGRYPLVLFLHGQCSDLSAQDHENWFRLPAALARSGFVVAVPDLGWQSGQAPWSTPSPQVDTALAVIDWMHTSFSGRQWLSGTSTLGLVGHSFGALLATRLAVEIPSSALVSIGGLWAEWPVTPPRPIPSLSVPSMFMYGTNDTFANQPGVLAQAPSPTHRVIFEGGDHWDHLDANNVTCDTPNGPCDLVDELTADLTVLYLSRVLRVATIPASLEPPAFTLSGEQMFYAGNHLTSFDALPGSGCDVTIEWNLPGAGSVTLPWP